MTRKHPPDTFAETSSSFLQSLTSKVSGSSISQNQSSNIQQTRSDIMNQVQSTHQKLEQQQRQLEKQLASISQEIRPKISNIERQQSNISKQIEDTRSQLQKLSTEEISQLQRSYEQLNTKFDRFMRVELENKLKPLSEELKQSQSKLSEISSSTSNTFKKLSDSVKELKERSGSQADQVKNQQNRFTQQIEEISPRIHTLESQIEQLSSLLNIEQTETSSSANLEGQLKKAQKQLDNLLTTIFPQQITANSQKFSDAIDELHGYCYSKIDQLQATFEEISMQNQMIDQQRQTFEDSLDSLVRTSFEVQSRIKQIDDESRSKLSQVDQYAKAQVTNLKSQFSDLTSDESGQNDRLQSQIQDDISNLRSQIQTSLRKLKDTIKTGSQGNQKAQEIALSELTQIKNSLMGDGNVIGRLTSIENQVQWCINTIQDVDKERQLANEKGFSQKMMIDKFNNFSQRLENTEQRLQKLDGKKAAPKPLNNTKGRKESIPPVPS